MDITIAGMGPNGEISENVRHIARTASAVVLQTSIGTSLDDAGIAYETLDAVYETSEDFDDLLNRSCDFLLRDDLLFITLGSICQNRIAGFLVKRASAAHASVTVVPDGDAALCAAFQAGLIDGSAGMCIYTATSFTRVMDTDMVIVVNELDTRYKASELKLNLSSCYGDEYSVFLVDTRTGNGKNILLCQLDYAASYGYYTSVVIPPCPLERKIRYTFSDLLDIMVRLRARDGCPWDKEQTHASLKRYLIEESYEVLEAIDDDDMDALCDELGDVLLQIVFHARIAEQQSEFDITDITTAICKKMIARHTHIFGLDVADTPQDVINNWEQIKKNERGQKTQTEVLHSVPRSMPALMRSGKVQHKAAHIGFDFRDVSQAIDKLREEIIEVEQETTIQALTEECGDLLFAAVNVSRLLGIEPETALQKATDKFIARFAIVEELSVAQDVDMRQCGIEILDDLWDKAKSAHKK